GQSMDSKDLDIEVFGLDREQLVHILGQFGRVDALVGQAYGVTKLTLTDGQCWDFSLPRREEGRTHTDVDVEVDPQMSFRDAALRRDFTMNALMFDPISGKIHDFFGGMGDIQSRVLRATSPKFAEDPLRVLR